MLSLLRQVTLHCVSINTKNTQASILKVERNIKIQAKMADANAMTEQIMQVAIVAAKAAVHAVAVARSEVGAWPRSEPVSLKPKISKPTLKQPTFD